MWCEWSHVIHYWPLILNVMWAITMVSNWNNGRMVHNGMHRLWVGLATVRVVLSCSAGCVWKGVGNTENKALCKFLGLRPSDHKNTGCQAKRVLSSGWEGSCEWVNGVVLSTRYLDRLDLIQSTDHHSDKPFSCYQQGWTQHCRSNGPHLPQWSRPPALGRLLDHWEEDTCSLKIVIIVIKPSSEVPAVSSLHAGMYVLLLLCTIIRCFLCMHNWV